MDRAASGRSTPAVLLLAAVVAVSLAAAGLVSGASSGPASGSVAQGPPATDHRGTAANRSPAIVAVYPNPIPDGDAGEFVVVRFPEPTNLSGWSLGDDEALVGLPNVTVSGRVAFTAAPSPAADYADARVLEVSEAPALANGGEPIVLVREGTVVDAVAYADAPEGELLVLPADPFDDPGDVAVANDGNAAAVPTDGVPHADLRTGTWRPLGATDRPVATVPTSEATAFALPDAASVPADVLRSADRRLLVAGYSFSSRRATRLLLDAVDRGVDVRVLLDGGPVGGITRRQVRLLDRLSAAGVPVRVLGGTPARYDFHHAKYAVADDRALVVTENWKPAGTGGAASRGWGVVVEDPRVAEELAILFAADANARDAVPWERYRSTVDPVESDPAAGSYPSRFEPETVPVESVQVLVAPDNAERAMVDLIADAETSIRVEQLSVGGPDGPLVSATLSAARRGVEVKLLLSGAWYVREDNAAVVEQLNRLADREDLPLEATVAEPRGRFEKVHAKGVIVDGEHVVVGSINWNANALRENREVAVVLTGEAAAAYYGRVFAADWNGGTSSLPLDGRDLPVGLAAALAAAGVVAVAVARWWIDFRTGRASGAGRGGAGPGRDDDWPVVGGGGVDGTIDERTGDSGHAASESQPTATGDGQARAADRPPPDPTTGAGSTTDAGGRTPPVPDDVVDWSDRAGPAVDRDDSDGPDSHDPADPS